LKKEILEFREILYGQEDKYGYDLTEKKI